MVLSPVLLLAGVTLTFGSEWGPALISLGIGSAVVWGITEAARDRVRRERVAVLSVLLGEGQARTRECQDTTADFDQTKRYCDEWGIRVEQYILREFGRGALAVYNSSDGLPMFGIVRRGGAEAEERANYETWCRLRCARLTELLARMSA